MFNALRTWRKARELRLEDVAKLAGVEAPATINRLERAEGIPTLKKRIALFIFNLTDGEVTANDLVGITPKMIAEKEKLRKKRGANARTAYKKR